MRFDLNIPRTYYELKSYKGSTQVHVAFRMYSGFVSGWKYPDDEKSDENMGALGLGVLKEDNKVVVPVVRDL
jgi:hypothetical protein